MTLQGSDSLVVLSVLVPLGLVAPVLWAIGHLVQRGELPRRALWTGPAATLAWLVLWGLVAHSGALDVWGGFPPRALPALATLFAASAWLAFSRTGDALARALSFRWLIGFQVFR